MEKIDQHPTILHLDNFPDIEYSLYSLPRGITLCAIKNAQHLSRYYDDIILSLPQQYRAHVESFYDQHYRLESALCYLMLAQHNSDMDIKFSQNGKPYDQNSRIFFSFSHANNACVCAICSREIGVDIVAKAPYDKALAEIMCTADELQNFDDISPSPSQFAEFIARKESYLKLNGGLLKDINQELDNHANFYPIAIDDNICVVCVNSFA